MDFAKEWCVAKAACVSDIVVDMRFRHVALVAILVAAGCAKQPEKLTVQVEPVLPLGKGSGEVVARTEPTTTLTAPPEITSESVEGMHDFVFETAGAPQGENPGWWQFEAKGLYHGRPVRFEFIFGPDGNKWEKSGSSELTLYSGFGKFMSRGETSDRLLEAMAHEYGLKAAARKMAKATVVGVISLQGDPAEPLKHPLKLKLFFADDESSPLYGELFLNLDAAKHRLTLAEKDPDYDAGVIRTLAGEGARHSLSSDR